MDQDLKAYLDTSFGAVHSKIDGLEKQMNTTIEPINRTLDRHTDDIAYLFDKDREQVKVCEQHRERTGERINDLHAWKTAIETQSGGKKWRTEQILIVVMALVTAGIGLTAAFVGG